MKAKKMGHLIPDAISPEDYIRSEVKKCVADLMARGIRKKAAYRLLCRAYSEITWNNAISPSPLGDKETPK